MKALLALAAAGEAVTGLILMVYPPIVVKLLFGAEIAGAGVVMSRIAGMSLIALGLACWLGRFADSALRGMMTYSVLAALYLLYLGIAGESAGNLLWLLVRPSGLSDRGERHKYLFSAWSWRATWPSFIRHGQARSSANLPGAANCT